MEDEMLLLILLFILLTLFPPPLDNDKGGTMPTMPEREEPPSGIRDVGLPKAEDEVGGLINFNPLVNEGIDDDGEVVRCC